VPPQLTTRQSSPEVQELHLAGSWHVGDALPPVPELVGSRLAFDARDVTAWDSALLELTTRILRMARERGIEVDRSGLPEGVQRLLALADATPVERKKPRARPGLLARIGLYAIARKDQAVGTLAAIGELSGAFIKLLGGHAHVRRRDVWNEMQAAGVSALGIVGLVSALVGLIIAFIGAVQLQVFGATIYVASLVGIAMVRDLGALMAAIVVAGRTGAAYAAELGTMRSTQELDAYQTLGISPYELLVLPRVLAVTLMLPVLCVYADLLGVAGGAFVSVVAMGIQPRLYLDQTIHAVTLAHLFGGIVKATTYGLLIGIAGCFIGLRAGRSAAGVGRAATSAVVMGIVLVIVACGAYAVLFYRLGL
jgi:phospholipid/cholesterol/gamma-HCH transport system permease protein